MKRQNLPAVFALSMIFSLLTLAGQANPETKTEADTLQVPQNVKVILNNSCFGCHNTDSRNDDAKEELDLKTWHLLTGTKRLLALKHIRETIEENEMPPKKFLQHKPEKALSAEQKQLLIDWVKKESTALLKK